ncbi:MAG: hypothetical protein GX907_03850 [Clostridiaceae bacterium]|nr:hypothetical protein [Clostridiaceae bacterium]
MTQIEKIEELLRRTGADYFTVKSALEESEGDMYEALKLIEQNVDAVPEAGGSATSGAADGAEESCIGCEDAGECEGAADECEGTEGYECVGESEDAADGEAGEGTCRDAESPDSETADERVTAAQVLFVLQEAIKRFGATSIEVRKGDEVAMKLSAPVGLISLGIAPIITLIGFGSTFVTDYEVFLILPDKTEVNVNEYAREQFAGLSGMAAEFGKQFRDAMSVVFGARPKAESDGEEAADEACADECCADCDDGGEDCDADCDEDCTNDCGGKDTAG